MSNGDRDHRDSRSRGSGDYRSRDCRDFRKGIVSDDPGERERALEHAASCPACSAVVEGQRALARRVEAWVDATPAPPEGAEERLLAAVRRQAREASPAATSSRERSADVVPFRRRLAWVALAAAAALVALVVAPRLLAPTPAPAQARRLMAADALAEALEAEQAHARAIARLERAVTPILATASSPDLPARYASLLLTYQDRLDHLDRTIADVRAFLDDNPGHASGRTLLLAAYADKTRVLQEVIELEEEIPS